MSKPSHHGKNSKKGKGNKKHGGHKHGQHGQQHGGGDHKGGGDKSKGNQAKNDFSIADYLKSPGPLVQPLDRKTLKKDVQASTKLQFGAEQRQLEAEQRASKGREGEISDWFDEYRKQLGMLQNASAKAYAGPTGDIAKTAAASGQYASKLRNKLNVQENVSADQRGAHTSPAASQTEAAGASIRGNTAKVFEDVLGAQGKAETSNLRAKKDIASRSKVDQLLRESARGRTIDSNLEDLASRKGAFKTDYKNTQRQSERDFYLGVLQAQLGKQASKRSAATATQTQQQETKRTKITQQGENKRARKSLQAQIHNNNMDFKASMKSLRAQLKNDQISHAEFLQTQHNEMVRAQQTNNRLRNEFNKTHNKHGVSKGTVSHSNSGSSSGNGQPKNDSTHVQQMVNFLRVNDKFAKQHSKAEVIQGLMSQSTTYSRPEALAAYAHWKKKGKQHFPKPNRPPGPGHTHR